MHGTSMPMHSQMANAVRFLAADAVQTANSGHAGMPMGMADVATVLFSRHLKFDPTQPYWPDRDRFVLSAGHGSMLLYALLHLTGYADMSLEEIKRFRQLGGRAAGHPELGHALGIEATTGPLGQGLAMAAGMALAERMLNARFGDELVDHRTYVIAGDGCLMEGVTQEAVSLAGHLRLAKLIVLFDDNGVTIDGPTDRSISDKHLIRFRGANWHVKAVDGYDPEAVSRAIEAAKLSDRPSFIACRTTIGYGTPTKAGTAAAHSSPLGAAEVQAARARLGWPHAPFEIPQDVAGAWLSAGARGRGSYESWQARLAAAPGVQQVEFAEALDCKLGEDWKPLLGRFKRSCAIEQPAWATRKASGEVLKVLCEAIPQLTGGSADLSEAVYTQTPSTASVTTRDFSGRHIHYGAREHAMAAIMNGLALHRGFIPYGGTFLVFTDYMRGAMRLSALMGQQVIYVLTHDSIGLGEDGPTHQSVETLSGLRALPNFYTFRPCDPIETAECWELALSNRRAPSAIVLSRQAVPTVRRVPTDDNLSARGGYVLAHARGGERTATIVATGSEVPIALAACDSLHAAGISAAVVSMPCWELFDVQDQAYRDAVLVPCSILVAVEAGVRHGWDKYIGRSGIFVGMTGFGASGPGEQLFHHFGITAERITEAVKNVRRTGHRFA